MFTLNAVYLMMHINKLSEKWRQKTPDLEKLTINRPVNMNCFPTIKTHASVCLWHILLKSEDLTKETVLQSLRVAVLCPMIQCC